MPSPTEPVIIARRIVPHRAVVAFVAFKPIIASPTMHLVGTCKSQEEVCSPQSGLIEKAMATLLVSTLLSTSPNHTARVVLDRQNFSKVLDWLRTLTYERCEDATTRRVVDDWAKAAREAAAKRNQLIHATWMMDEAGKTGALSVKVTPKGIDAFWERVRVDRIQDVEKEFRYLEIGFWIITESLRDNVAELGDRLPKLSDSRGEGHPTE